MTALARVSDDLLLAAQSGDRHALTQLLVALQPDMAPSVSTGDIGAVLTRQELKSST